MGTSIRSVGVPAEIRCGKPPSHTQNALPQFFRCSYTDNYLHTLPANSFSVIIILVIHCLKQFTVIWSTMWSRISMTHFSH